MRHAVHGFGSTANYRLRLWHRDIDWPDQVAARLSPGPRRSAAWTRKGRQMDDIDRKYRECRDVWNDYNHQQEFEHQLIDRKTTWWLTSQTILFAAYGVSFQAANARDAALFRAVVAGSGLAIGIVTFIGVAALVGSKIVSWMMYRNFYSRQGLVQLPQSHRDRELQWGVRTWNTPITLLPDLLAPIVFIAAWSWISFR